jgi:DNA-binding NtrC family response regulator
LESHLRAKHEEVIQAHNFFPSYQDILSFNDPDIANLFKLSLEREGFVVHTFNDPLLALANYKPGEYDLLLFDIKMPHIDGFELYLPKDQARR